MFSRFGTSSGSPALPDGRVVRDLVDDAWQIRLDLAPQVLSLALHEAFALRAEEPALVPTCPDTGGFVSASMLAARAKLFDDGLYAAVELTAQPSKARLLTALADLSPRVAAAARLGGADIALSPEAQRLTANFLEDETASKPLGFYTWSEALRRIFQQDRLLQQELGAADAAALTSALDGHPALKTSYGMYLDCVAQLTNPPAADQLDLRHPLGRFLFPPSRAHESDLVSRLFSDRPVPDRFSLADEMVSRLLDGRLQLDPTAESGWYDLQTWALEPLVRLDRTPEASRLQPNDEYRRQLQELFKAVLALTRETHVKQLRLAVAAARGGAMPVPSVWVQPELTVEPMRTYYERRAEGYAFVREVLESSGALSNMRRQTATGAEPRPLDEELIEMIDLFRGAATVAGHELGMAPASDPERGTFARLARQGGFANDVRMMVPVFYDRGRQKTKVWAMLGWTTRTLVVTFATPPAVEVLRGNPNVGFGATLKTLAIPIFAEAYVSRLLDRDAFRTHCDQHRTRTAILEHLA